MYERMMQLLDRVTDGFSDYDEPFWVFTACILLSKLRREQRRPPVIPFKNVRELVFTLVGLIKLALVDTDG
jgi:hypothetical protein